jgi:hypothetical protein
MSVTNALKRIFFKGMMNKLKIRIETCHKHTHTHTHTLLFCKITSVSIHSFVEWLDTFSYTLRPADMTVKEINHIRCFAIDIAKDLILLSCTCNACHRMIYTGRPSMKV